MIIYLCTDETIEMYRRVKTWEHKLLSIFHPFTTQPQIAPNSLFSLQLPFLHYFYLLSSKNIRSLKGKVDNTYVLHRTNSTEKCVFILRFLWAHFLRFALILCTASGTRLEHIYPPWRARSKSKGISPRIHVASYHSQWTYQNKDQTYNKLQRLRRRVLLREYNAGDVPFKERSLEQRKS